MAATRSQKIRLSIFLITSTVIVIATLLYLMGASLLQVRDEYTVLLHGGSGGLEVGGQVRFNDINVGRIESVRLDEEDPSLIRIIISLEHGTPVTDDTVAMPEMTGITGSKRLAMKGGNKNSKKLKPGDTIVAQNSDLGAVVTKVINIADKLEDLLDNLVAVTNPTNMDKISTILAEVEGITNNVNQLLDNNKGNIDEIVLNAKDVIAKVDSSMDKIESAVEVAQKAIGDIATPHNTKKVTTILDSVNLLVENVSNRASDQELGQTIQSVNRLVSDTNVTVLRLRTDLQRVMRELETSVENINEFTQILVENPSVLISGRTEKERQLPR
ncbi:MAG: MCE family protein [Proteobacteria bacterium]|nr:MCE family protein [Pseudomonadota bacterium]